MRHPFYLIIFVLLASATSGPSAALGQDNTIYANPTARGDRPTNSTQTQQQFERSRQEEWRRPGAVNAPRRRAEKYKLSSEDKRLLKPATEDERAHADFLRRPGTGIFRLLPYRAGAGRVVSAKDVDAPAVLTNGAGSFYSFSKAQYGSDKWSELLLEDDAFKAGVAAESLGVMVNLGDVPLDSLSASSAGVAELAKYEPTVDYRVAIRQHVRNTAGFRLGKFTYKASLPVLPDVTYALRATNYDKSDTLVAFRVVREGEDGGLTILWKNLQTYPVKSLKGKPQD